MHDDKSQNNDDIFDNEAFDDDLSDESWDELDDDGIDLNDEDSDIDEDEAFDDEFDDDDLEEASLSEKSKDRTFLQKHFNTIVIAIVLLGGGAYFLGGMGSSSSVTKDPASSSPEIEPSPEMVTNQTPDLSQQDISEIVLTGMDEPSPELAPLEDEDTLPVPTPLEFSQGKDITSILDISSIDAAEEEPIEDISLTPMPALDQSEASDTELVDLSPLVPGQSETSDTKLADLNPVAFDIETSEAPEPIKEQPILDDISLKEPDPSLALPTPVTTDTFSLSSTPDLEEITALKEQLSQAQKDLESITSSKNRAIDDLKSTLESLQKELKALKQENSSLSSQIKNSGAQKDVVKATVSSLPNAPKIEWILRSAQPGKAVLSFGKSNDLRTIEVGDQISGLGKITFIGLKDGLWVVKGDQGKVSSN